jgi:hypothetical protein
MKKIITLTAALFIVLTMLPASGVGAGDTRLTIIHSSNLNGYLAPCPT